ncbi:unnamed protein product, partial [Owenia fusiformis]
MRVNGLRISPHVDDNEGLLLRDSDYFVSGGIHFCETKWRESIPKHANGPDSGRLLSWIREGVLVADLWRDFKGNFKGLSFNAPIPPRRYFPNHASCIPFSQFIADTLSSRIKNGSIRVWGKVGQCQLPRIIMPLTVEPSKPRLCHDERFLNLWVRDLPFQLETLKDVTRIAPKDAFMFKTDEFSRFDHVKIHPDDQTYFGIAFG